MQVFGLIGNPVGHSLSPPMHEAAYRALDMDARYCAFEPDPDDLRPAIEGAGALGIVGLNVTIPFKQAAFELCEPDDLAARIGAVNTLAFRDRESGELEGDTRPRGYNTDAYGAIRALEDGGVALEGRAVVVGAGGAGRAIAFGLADEGMDVAIANRTAEKAHALAAAVLNATGHGLEALPELLDDADVLVNATSVGAKTDESPVSTGALHADLGVLDAVYRPAETRLLREAAGVGATTVDGGWMLLYQGVEAFERWTGEPAPVDAMRGALRARL